MPNVAHSGCRWRAHFGRCVVGAMMRPLRPTSRPLSRQRHLAFVGQTNRKFELDGSRFGMKSAQPLREASSDTIRRFAMSSLARLSTAFHAPRRQAWPRPSRRFASSWTRCSRGRSGAWTLPFRSCRRPCRRPCRPRPSLTASACSCGPWPTWPRCCTGASAGPAPPRTRRPRGCRWCGASGGWVGEEQSCSRSTGSSQGRPRPNFV
mmetsp:Transcript_47123/g.134484  ORF Transcript_47123/g.134484 Transcript_47123/m.134484 type:complete len:207 (-) Transcript_47123:450-1070(-)